MSFNVFGASKPAPPFNFGSSTTTPQATQASAFGSGFGGASSTQPAAAAPSFGGGFGTTSTAQPATSGFGGFGQNAQQPQQQQQQPAFGAPQTTQGGFGGGTGLFGAANNAAPQGNSFGGFGNANASTSGTNTFGAPAQGGGMFGQQSQQQQPSGLFGQSAQNQNQNQYNPSAPPGQRFPTREQQLQNPKAKLQDYQGIPSLYGPSGRPVPVGVFTNREVGKDETFEIMKREDPLMAQELEKLEMMLREQQDAWDMIKPEDLGTKILSNQRQIAEVQTGYNTYLSSCLKVKSDVDALNKKLEEYFKEVSGVYRVVEWQKENVDTQRGFEMHRDVPANFFIKLARENKERIEQYTRTIDQIERQLYSLSQDQRVPTVQAISDTINNNQDVILTLAGQVADLDSRVQKMVDDYRKDYRRRNQTIEDPVEVARVAKGQPEGGYAKGGGISMAGVSLRG